MAMPQTIKYEAERDPAFGRWAESITGGENIKACIQCGLCSATCPLSLYMDFTPRRLINLARAGFRKEVLSSFTIWLCASCYACRVECPKQIQVTDIMYALKRRAIREGAYPRKFPIAVLAREFGRMIFHLGRTSEAFLVADLFLRTNWLRFLDMTGLGFGLMRTGRMSWLPESIKARSQLQKILGSLDGKDEFREWAGPVARYIHEEEKA